uniref:Uncharacterized protein n=1 Tax=Arundo donax TaxID=35708 RepID=A0A0A9BR31_ARUDO
MSYFSVLRNKLVTLFV